MKKLFRNVAVKLSGAFFAASMFGGCMHDDNDREKRIQLAILGLLLANQQNTGQPTPPTGGGNGGSGETCTSGEGTRVDPGTDGSFIEKTYETPGDSSSDVTSCAITMTFNNNGQTSTKKVYLTPGNGSLNGLDELVYPGSKETETVTVTDTCGNVTTRTATEEEKHQAAEKVDQLLENIFPTGNPARGLIIPGEGESNEETDYTHVNSLRVSTCQY